jgi:cobalt-zinc-cadmium efflux system protein
MSAEVVAGLYTGSLALLADAGHMLSDAAAIGLALFAFWFAARPATHFKSYGYHRTEILATMANTLMLMGVSLFVLFTAFQRFSLPPTVDALPMVWVALGGIVVNLISVRALHSSAKELLNVKGAYLEVLSDLFASVGVLSAGLIMMFTRWYWVDPAISVLIGMLIIPRSWKLLSECINILMEGTPSRIDLHAMEQSIKSVDGVTDVHDLHVWTITSGLDAMSAHVIIENGASNAAVLDRVSTMLKSQFNIKHSTIQVEVVACQDACVGCDKDACGSATNR